MSWRPGPGGNLIKQYQPPTISDADDKEYPYIRHPGGIPSVMKLSVSGMTWSRARAITVPGWPAISTGPLGSGGCLSSAPSTRDLPRDIGRAPASTTSGVVLRPVQPHLRDYWAIIDEVIQFDGRTVS